MAAVASFAQARARRGRWLVRVEDIDPPREVPGSAQGIIADLRRLGMEPDEILYQSASSSAHQSAWKCLLDEGLAYWCGCSRKDLTPGAPYPGTCAEGLSPTSPPRSIRVRVGSETIEFSDAVQGPQSESLSETCGDFVIRRADALPAYQLAVVVDDAAQGVTEIVRGADLLDSTARQIHLQNLLGYPRPGYLHVPVVVDRKGAKLGKRFDADPVRALSPERALRQALLFLGQAPPAGMGLESLWQWAVGHWNIEAIAGSHKR